MSAQARSAAAGRRTRWAAGLTLGGAVALAAVWMAQPASKPAPSARPVARPAAQPVHFSETDPAAGGAQLTAEAAAQINAAIPFSALPVRAAAPFRLAAGADHDRALGCLTQAIYFEAGFEPREGQEAVAQVILNRVRHPAFPKTVCGVVYEGAGAPGCQFTFACDGALARTPAAAAWGRARAVAQAALEGHVQSQVGESTHYHADYVAPYWGRQLAKVAKIGAHIFYRWPGAWGEPQSFAMRYAGHETPWSPTPAGIAAPPTQVAAAGPEEPHAPDDVGGRVVVGLGWTPAAPQPTTDSLAKIMANQNGTPARTAQAAVAGGAGAGGS
ncbi:cell wall hydrolase [Caulobacter sp. KR2-114]|uniref:cell wall hydrolase n=1 Tax=Caulobacter sp. KR2-114 TaxID=3400912 RepID=UPI003C005D39